MKAITALLPMQSVPKHCLKIYASTQNRTFSCVAKCHGEKVPELQTDVKQM
jgi:hypothetical protein